MEPPILGNDNSSWNIYDIKLIVESKGSQLDLDIKILNSKSK